MDKSSQLFLPNHTQSKTPKKGRCSAKLACSRVSLPCYRCAYCLEADSRTSTPPQPPFVSHLGVHYLSKTFGLKRVCSASFFLANCISRSFTNYNCYTSLPLIEVIMPVLRATTRRTVQLVTTPPDVRPRQQDKLDNDSRIFYIFFFF